MRTPKHIPLIITLICLLMGTTQVLLASSASPKAIAGLLDRIGGKGTSSRMVTRLDASLKDEGRDCFRLSSCQGKPLVEGSSLTAIGAGINWYLNHYAHVNLSWNQLTADLSKTAFPLPERMEVHVCSAGHRYYLNYCTFGYSMATWTWERWEQEIDWMALHGINMPLQIVGLEWVWRDFLMKDCHYTEQEAEDFVPGPAFTPWWGMNNLEGWGGDGRLRTDRQTMTGRQASGVEAEEGAPQGVHLDAWYKRQRELAQKICRRERELGMQPVLPGFSGMVPSNFETVTGIPTEKANLWCQFQRPAILDPIIPEFMMLAHQYYKRLHEVMGDSFYYSMDSFHEGGTISSGRYAEGYQAVFEAMNVNCGADSRWVIQQWQWSGYQRLALTSVPAGRLLVLDLFSDGHPAFDVYQGYAPQKAIYCTIPNYGGRTGFMGRLARTASGYFLYKVKYSSVQGIGTAAEAIESMPVVYDLLYELPWLDQEPDMEAWISAYASARYGGAHPLAVKAWRQLLRTALNEETSLQGPHESAMCARPSLVVDRVSSWGGTTLFYDPREVEEALGCLLSCAPDVCAGSAIGQENLSYDITDLARQVMSDYSLSLLAELRQAHDTQDGKRFAECKDRFLQLILDTDRLLGTHPMFRLGRWTTSAREVAREVKRHAMGKEKNIDIERIADWLEYDNARLLITTWGDHLNSEQGGLRDYSYRQWQGMLRDYYYPRWDYYFNHQTGSLSAPPEGWFASEWNWAHDLQAEWGAAVKGSSPRSLPRRYSPQPVGDTYATVRELIQKYGQKVQ